MEVSNTLSWLDKWFEFCTSFSHWPVCCLCLNICYEVLLWISSSLFSYIRTSCVTLYKAHSATDFRCEQSYNKVFSRTSDCYRQLRAEKSQLYYIMATSLLLWCSKDVPQRKCHKKEYVHVQYITVFKVHPETQQQRPFAEIMTCAV